ncbi:MAG: hypothetical protein RLZZ40_18 [Actinomycetota bacterium]
MSAAEQFNNEQHRDEVVERWGQDAWTRSSSWWKALGELGQKAFMAEGTALRTGYTDAREQGLAVDSEAVVALVERHRVWISQAWGGIDPTAEQFRGLADMYVADERFARHYGGHDGASYVRDAIYAWTESAH